MEQNKTQPEDIIEHLLNQGLTATIAKTGQTADYIMGLLKEHMPHMFVDCECRNGKPQFCAVPRCCAYGLSFKYNSILK